jgi:hypothetical protein
MRKGAIHSRLPQANPFHSSARFETISEQKAYAPKALIFTYRDAEVLQGISYPPPPPTAHNGIARRRACITVSFLYIRKGKPLRY